MKLYFLACVAVLLFLLVKSLPDQLYKILALSPLIIAALFIAAFLFPKAWELADKFIDMRRAERREEEDF